jgi:hypothetical protein
VFTLPLSCTIWRFIFRGADCSDALLDPCRGETGEAEYPSVVTGGFPSGRQVCARPLRVFRSVAQSAIFLT